jgi:hypothetical protein
MICNTSIFKEAIGDLCVSVSIERDRQERMARSPESIQKHKDATRMYAERTVEKKKKAYQYILLHPGCEAREMLRLLDFCDVDYVTKILGPMTASKDGRLKRTMNYKGRYQYWAIAQEASCNLHVA